MGDVALPLSLDPHEVVDRGLEALIEYVESVHALSATSPAGDELVELLLGAQEVVRERRRESTTRVKNPHRPRNANGGRVR